MNLLDVQDSSIYESMQGVVGFKSYASREVENLIWRWRKGFEQNESNMEIRDLSMSGVRAYDATWVLAEAIERAGIELPQNWVPGAGSAIMRQITGCKLTGLVGKFQLASRKLVPGIYEILNVIHKGERRVGFWTSAYGFTMEINPSINSSLNMLETILWPGFSSMALKSWLVKMSGRSFKIVVPAYSTFTELIDLNHDWQHNVTTFSGSCIEVFNAAVDRLSHKISYEYVPFANEYGTYNDLIYQVYLQNYDAAVGDITILSNRSA